MIYEYDFLCLKRNWISFSGQVAAAADVLKLTTREVCAATGRPSKVVFLQWKPWFFFCIAFRRLWDWDFHYRWNFGRFSTSAEWINFRDMCCSGFDICLNMLNKPEIFVRCFYNGACQNEQNRSICSGYGAFWWTNWKSHIYVSSIIHTWRILLSHQVKSLDIDYLKVSGTFMKSPGDPREFKLGYRLALC